MAIDIKISELNEISSNKTINQLIVNDRSNSSDPGTTRKISISNLLPTYDASDANKRAIVGNDQLISTAQSPGLESVNTNVIRDSAITTGKIAAAAVTGDKIANSTITSSNIASNTILGSNINNTTDVTINNVAANNITTSNVTASSNLQGNSLNITSGNTTINNKSYTWPNNYTGDRYLKVSASGALSWDQPVTGTGTTFVYDDVLPVGAILPWASNSTPANYLICDGTYFDGTIYSGLSAVLGTTYGPFISPKWYKLPDLRGKVPVGVGTNISDLSGNTQTFTLGTSGGEYKHQLTIGELPAHSHNFLANTSSGGLGTVIDVDGINGNPTGATTFTTSSTGSNESHNNIQPYVVTNYIIKAKPDPKVDFGLTIGAGLSANTATGNINLSGGAIRARVDNSTIVINGSNQLSLNNPLSSITVTNGVRGGLSDGGLVSTGASSPLTVVIANGNVPNWAKRITILFTTVNTSGTRLKQFQVGSSSAGWKESGYNGVATRFSGTSLSNILSQTGIILSSTLAAEILNGTLTLNYTENDTNDWIATCTWTNSSGTTVGGQTVCRFSMPDGVIESIRITTLAPSTNTFSSGGQFKIYYEG